MENDKDDGSTMGFAAAAAVADDTDESNTLNAHAQLRKNGWWSEKEGWNGDRKRRPPFSRRHKLAPANSHLSLSGVCLC